MDRLYGVNKNSYLQLYQRRNSVTINDHLLARNRLKPALPAFNALQQDIFFAGSDRIKEFNLLPLPEQEKIKDLTKELFASKDALFTLIGKKPSAHTCINLENYKTLCKHKQLLESNNIKFVLTTLKDHEKNFTGRIFVVNTEETLKVIDNNIDLYRYKLDNKNLTSKEILDALLKPDSPLLDFVNNNELIGVTLGYPLSDSILFRLHMYVRDIIPVVRNKYGDNDNIDTFLTGLEQILMPEGNIASSITLKTIDQIRSNMGLNNSRGFAMGANNFHTWDIDNPEIKQLRKKIQEGMQEIKTTFKEPEDLLNYLFKLD